MARISIHYTHLEIKPEIDAEITRLSAFVMLRVSEPGTDHVAFFFNNDEEVIDFVDKMDQALTSYLIERGVAK